MTLPPRPRVHGLTIDPPDACDLDDAIDVHKHQDGWRILVSIADVAEHVHVAHAADQEAYQRAFTRYFADDNEPMFPQDLVEGRLSLLPGHVRDTLTFGVDVDTCFEVTGLDIAKTQMMSEMQLSYDHVSDALDTPEDPRHRYWSEALELAYGLFEQRRTRGALAIFDPGMSLRSTEEGTIVRMPEGPSHRAYLIVQELMILVNHAVTAHLLARGLTLLLRNHTTRQADVRTRYLRELAALMLAPSAAVLAQLNHQVVHLLDRAHYSPVNHGHVGLNLPSYAHWTSPIRRYADLVNHRLLRAWLDGHEPPYSFGALETIGAHVGEVADGLRQERHLAQTHARLETLSQADEATLAALDGPEMRDLLAHLATGTIALSASCAAEVHRRLRHDAFTTSDMTRLLFAPRSEGRWSELKEEALRWLTGHLGQVFHVLNVGHYFYGWPSIDELVWHESHLGPRHMPTFCAEASMVHGGQRLTSQAAVSSTKHNAQQWALLSLLSRVAGLDFTLPAERAEATASLRGPLASNPKGRLMELTQALKQAAPAFAFSEHGPSHHKRYSCVASLQLESQHYRSAPCLGTSKKEAERFAALDILTQLPDAIAEGGKRKEKSLGVTPGKNPVSVLQEWTSQHAYEPPLYDFARSGPPHASVFVCTCEVRMEQEVTQWQGVGMTKKAAKAHAAQAACQTLLDLVETSCTVTMK